MTDYTKEAEELYPSEYRNSADIYNKADLADAKQEAHIAARQQSAAEIDRLRGEVERLTMDNMTHEFNQAEAEKFAPEYERQIREDEANKWRGEVERLSKIVNTKESERAEWSSMCIKKQKQIDELNDKVEYVSEVAADFESDKKSLKNCIEKILTMTNDKDIVNEINGTIFNLFEETK